MTLISLLSVLAGSLGLAGIVPQLARMVRARSASGQSPLGWILGAVANLCMLYVNLVGYGAPVLAASSASGFVLCASAAGLVLWLGRRDVAPAGPDIDVHALPTQEFEVLAGAVRAAQLHRAAATC